MRDFEMLVTVTDGKIGLQTKNAPELLEMIGVIELLKSAIVQDAEMQTVPRELMDNEGETTE